MAGARVHVKEKQMDACSSVDNINIIYAPGSLQRPISYEICRFYHLNKCS